ncbi:MAG TPA: 30S ribosomal protein THX [Saprospiraceae bacterium]|nr:30S ribosomal protein THX [Saprospiraceae bacterium]
MGRGDRKTKRGKISSGSYGNSRPKSTKGNKKKVAA